MSLATEDEDLDTGQEPNLDAVLDTIDAADAPPDVKQKLVEIHGLITNEEDPELRRSGMANFRNKLAGGMLRQKSVFFDPETQKDQPIPDNPNLTYGQFEKMVDEASDKHGLNPDELATTQAQIKEKGGFNSPEEERSFLRKVFPVFVDLALGGVPISFLKS